MEMNSEKCLDDGRILTLSLVDSATRTRFMLKPSGTGTLRNSITARGIRSKFSSSGLRDRFLLKRFDDEVAGDDEDSAVGGAFFLIESGTISVEPFLCLGVDCSAGENGALELCGSLGGVS